MDNNNLQTIDIRRILALSPVIDEYALGTDIILGTVSGSQVEKSQAILKMLRYPVRFDGFIIFFIRKGNFSVNLNLSTFNLSENTLLVAAPGNIIQLPSYSEDRLPGTELSFVLMSPDFLRSVPFNLDKMTQDSIRLWKNPCITLSGETLSLAEDYYRLGRRVLSSAQPNKKEILRALLTSFTYVTLDVWEQQALSSPAAEADRSSARVGQIFDRFIGLVTEYHTSQRGMAFYADKLCLTPKYLSKLVKQASGRSAPEWIDEFVILEAKNLLRYSNMAIKEIVFALNFPNQSVFYKFFKAHTGQTPSEYRKE